MTEPLRGARNGEKEAAQQCNCLATTFREEVLPITVLFGTIFWVDASHKANPLNCLNSLDWLAQHDNNL